MQVPPENSNTRQIHRNLVSEEQSQFANVPLDL